METILILPIRNCNCITSIKAHVYYKPMTRLLILQGHASPRAQSQGPTKIIQPVCKISETYVDD